VNRRLVCGFKDTGGNSLNRDDETSPGVLTGNANFQGTDVHDFFLFATIPFYGNHRIGRIKLAQKPRHPRRMVSKPDGIDITVSNDYVN
jgi:hypothetical protein